MEIGCPVNVKGFERGIDAKEIGYHWGGAVRAGPAGTRLPRAIILSPRTGLPRWRAGARVITGPQGRCGGILQAGTKRLPDPFGLFFSGAARVGW